MGISATIAAVAGTVVAADMASNAASDAADVQSAATANAAELERKTAQENLALQEKMYQEGVSRQQPYYEAGKSALARLQAGIAPGGEFTQQYGGIITDPSYQFRLAQGQRALDASAASKGQLFTAGQQQAVQKYGQDLASTEYSAGYNRFIDERQRQLANISSLAGAGSTTATGLASLGQTYANTASTTAQQAATAQSNALTSGAAAQAAGMVGGANAWSKAAETSLGAYQQYQTNKLLTDIYKPATITPVA